MPIYYVKTNGNRHLAIEADSFELNRESDSYIFVREMETKSGVIANQMVAAIPFSSDILAVIEQKSSKGDAYFSVIGGPFTEEPEREAPPVEYRMIEGTDPAWGFVTENKFFPFDCKETAEDAAVDWAHGERLYEGYPIEETTQIPGVVN